MCIALIATLMLAGCNAQTEPKASPRAGANAVDPYDVYEWGSAQMRMQRKGKASYVVGRYLTVWHRSGKSWLITRNIAF